MTGMKFASVEEYVRNHTQTNLNLPSTPLKTNDTRVKIQVLFEPGVAPLSRRVNLHFLKTTAHIKEGNSYRKEDCMGESDNFCRFWPPEYSDNHVVFWMRFMNPRDCSCFLKFHVQFILEVKTKETWKECYSLVHGFKTRLTAANLKNKTMTEIVGRGQPVGLITKKTFVNIRSKFEDLAERGELEQVRNYAEALRKSELYKRFSNDFEVVLKVEEFLCLYSQDKLEDGKRCLDGAMALVPKLQDRATLEGRILYHIAAYFRKSSLHGKSEEMLSKAKLALDKAGIGEDTAELVYNEARYQMILASANDACGGKQLVDLKTKFNYCIDHYSRDPFDDCCNKICRCLLNLAQLYLDCPVATTNWMHRPHPSQDLIENGADILSCVVRSYWSGLTERTRCRFMYTKAGLFFREGKYTSAMDTLNEAIDIAQSCKLTSDYRRWTVIRDYWITITDCQVALVESATVGDIEASTSTSSYKNSLRNRSGSSMDEAHGKEKKIAFISSEDARSSVTSEDGVWEKSKCQEACGILGDTSATLMSLKQLSFGSEESDCV